MRFHFEEQRRTRWERFKETVPGLLIATGMAACAFLVIYFVLSS